MIPGRHDERAPAAHRHPRLEAGAGPDRSGLPRARAARTQSSPRRTRSRPWSSARPAIGSPTGRSPSSAARACSARSSRRRCSSAGSTSRCIRSRTCRPGCPAAWRSARCSSAKIPRDVLLARTPAPIAALPEAALIGTASVRRKAQLLARRPDLRVVNFRGNVDTRLRKLAAGEVDATLLALAGLRRLGIEPCRRGPRRRRRCCPRSGRARSASNAAPKTRRAWALLAAIDHAASSACVRAERALLAALDGSCHTPIAGYAEISDQVLHLRALIARPDGSVCLRTARTGAPRDAEAARAGCRRRSSRPAPARASSTERTAAGAGSDHPAARARRWSSRARSSAAAIRR